MPGGSVEIKIEPTRAACIACAAFTTDALASMKSGARLIKLFTGSAKFTSVSGAGKFDMAIVRFGSGETVGQSMAS
jgi:hypothetical protein